MSDSFVGNFTGQDYNNHTTVSIHAGSPPPGQDQPAPTPVVGPGTVTIVLDGEAGQIKAGGGGTHVGSIQLLNGLGKVIASLGNNPTGLQIYRAGGAGVLNALTAEIRGEPEGSLTLTNTVAGNNTYGIGASASAVTVYNSTVSSNAVGISADRTTITRISQSTVTGNGTGLQATNGGQMLSFGNNNVSGNGTDGVATTTVAMQ